MAETKARHAHGLSENVDAAIAAKKIDAFDVLFLDAGTDNPKIGWIDKDGNKIVVNENLDADLKNLGDEIAKKANTTEVANQINDAMIDALNEAATYTNEKIAAEVAKVSNAVEVVEF